MKVTFKVLAILLVSLIGSPAFAQSSVDELSTCLVDNLSGKERKNLAKWIFFSVGAHPEIKAYSQISPKDIQTSDEFVGKLITRLLTVNCAVQLKTAYLSDPLSVKYAFEMVGRVAMQELMTSNDVQQAITNYAKFADVAKINKVVSQK